MKIQSIIVITLLGILLIGCASNIQDNISQTKKNPLLQPFNLIVTSDDTSNQGIVNDMYSVIGKKLDKKFEDRIVKKNELSPHGIKIEVIITQVEYVPSVIRFFFKENSGDARLKAKVEITDLYKDELIHEAYLSKESSPRRGKGKSTPDHIEEVADDIVFMLKSSRI